MLPKPCQCAFETALAMRRRHFGKYKHMGRKLRASYIAQQEVTQKAMEASGYDDDMPPCVNCHPEVFAYCSTVGHECKIFAVYTTTGKVGMHTCFHKLAKLKVAQPKMAKYCSEDCQKITVPKTREFKSKARTPNAEGLDV